MSVWVVSILGAILLGLPLLGSAAPTGLVLVAVTGAAVTGLMALELAARRLDNRRLALLVAVAALDSVLRLLVVTGVAGFTPIFLLILCCGACFGARFGLLTGAFTMLLSAVVTGGVGPWLPYEMIAAGWVGMAGALVHRPSVAWTRGRLWLLAGIGVICGFGYGAVTDLWDWTVFYRGVPDIGFAPGLGALATATRFGRFYTATSLAWDSVRAVGNAAMVLALGPPVLAAMGRFERRFSVIYDAPTQPVPRRADTEVATQPLT